MKISIEDNLYPELLRKIKNPPKTLYLKGNIELLKNFGIAIIGSRRCTEYGKKIAKKFASELSLYGLNVISGMAIGIDSYSHIGAINSGGKTIAVLPSGFKNIYPEENKNLYKKIIESDGLIITEYEDDVIAESKKFLERNRIVSGLSIGVLVVEGGKKSGTSVTARIATEQNRLLFCIPSSIENPLGVTPNKLIKQGAILVTDVNDIIEKYKYLTLKKENEQNKLKRNKINIDIQKEYIQVYNVLPDNDSIHINEIYNKLKIDIQEINYKLMMLELQGKVVALPGNNYKKYEDM